MEQETAPNTEQEVLERRLEELKLSAGQVEGDFKEREQVTIPKLAQEIQELKERNQNDAGVVLNENQVATAEEVAEKVEVRLPEEVWRIILGKLSDPKDLWNATNVCQLFEGILRPWKTGWMLEQALPYLYKHLSGSKLLECREVSKGWYEGVNNFLDNHPSMRPLNDDDDRDPRRLEFVYPVKEKKLEKHYRFGNREDMSFLDSAQFQELQRLGKSPFLGHNVTLTLGSHTRLNHRDEPGWEDREWWPRVEQFLEWFGKNIWYLTLNFRGNGLRESERLREKLDLFLSVELFGYAPNLRKLSINGVLFSGLNDPTPVREESAVRGSQLESLECLECTMLGGGGVIEALFERHRLQLRKASNSHVNRLPGREWPNLTELHLNSEVVELRNQRGLRNLRLPHLKKLTFGMHEFCGPDRFSFPTLIPLLNDLSTSSTQLSAVRLVGLGPKGRLLWSRKYQLGSVVAPKSLKTLEIVEQYRNTPGVLHSYEVILRRFPYLENLHLIWTPDVTDFILQNPSPSIEVNFLPRPRPGVEEHVEMDEQEEEEGILDINKFILKGAMYESNIWELMPFLNVFSFQWDVFTRDGYEEYLRKKTSSDN